jgi:sarcosine oxidase / L-pipecolate oxidase
MTASTSTVLIAGSGIYGLTAALELRRRGHTVHLFDPGPLPHPLAASTDISKVIRMEYGADEDYTAAMEIALDRWRAWNLGWPEPLYHEVGVMFATRQPMRPGAFEGDSYDLVRRRGHAVERVDADLLRRRYPAWNAERYIDGVFNPAGGYAESGRVVSQLLAEAQAAGVNLHERQTLAGLVESGGRVTGLRTPTGEQFDGDTVLLAAGSWTPHLLRALRLPVAEAFRSTGMPVFHLKPADPTLFAAERFPTFGADISRTGYYGFPLHPREGVVKIANHGDGRAMPPDSPERVVTAEETAQLRAFLADTFPALAEAPIVYTRVCLYCDTWDGHFWIAEDPERPGLVLSTGGSGHGFKFAPLLGDWAADAVEGRTHAFSHKFRWRPEVRPALSEEAARFQPAAQGR